MAPKLAFALALGAAVLAQGGASAAPDYEQMSIIYAETWTAEDHCDFENQVDVILKWADAQLTDTILKEDVTVLVLYTLRKTQFIGHDYRKESAAEYCDALRIKYGPEGSTVRGALIGSGRPKD